MTFSYLWAINEIEGTRLYQGPRLPIGVLPEVSGWAENLDFRKKWRRRRRNWRRWRRMSSREE
jgi:hypothetical protein